MTTKTLSSLIIAGVLAASAAAAVHVTEPALVPVPVSSCSLATTEAATSDHALFLLRVSTAPNHQRPAGIVRLTR